jgi:hypothetical protein
MVPVAALIGATALGCDRPQPTEPLSGGPLFATTRTPITATILGLPVSSSAQSILDQSFTSPGDLTAVINECCAFVGQTYTAGVTGTLAGISIDVESSGPFPLHVAIRAVAGGLPTTTVLGDVTLGSSSSALSQLIVFPQVIPQVAGVQYTIVVNYLGAPPPGPGQAQGGWAGATGNAYPGGDLLLSFNGGVSWFVDSPDFDLHFKTFISPPLVQIAIDIKPATFPNSINPRSAGVMAVAILTTDTFDATTVDPATVRFGPTGTEAVAAHAALEDVDGDGDKDLILHFKTQDTGFVCGDASASLTGDTVDGRLIEGSDSIKTVGCREEPSRPRPSSPR